MELISCIKNFPKHCKTAIQNIWRNGVMSISSIFAVTITLVLIAVIGVIAINVQDMTYNIEISDKTAKAIQPKIEAIDGVKAVTFSSKNDELNKLIESQNKDGKKLFESYRKNNPLGAAYVVEVKDTKQLDKVANQIGDLKNVNDVNYGGCK